MTPHNIKHTKNIKNKNTFETNIDRGDTKKESEFFKKKFAQSIKFRLKVIWNQIKISFLITLIQVYSIPIKLLRPTTILKSIQRLQLQSKKEFSKLSKKQKGVLKKTIKSQLLDPKLTERIGLLEAPFPHYAIQILHPQKSYSFPNKNDRVDRYKNLSINLK